MEGTHGSLRGIRGAETYCVAGRQLIVCKGITMSGTDGVGSGGATGGAAAPTSTGGSATPRVKVDDANLAQLEPDAHTDAISELLSHHRTELDALRERVKDAIPASGDDGTGFRYDDIFLLRYVLSFGTADAAEPMVRETIEYRASEAHQAISRAVADGTWRDDPRLQMMTRFQCFSVLEGAQSNGGPLLTIRAGMSDIHAVNRHVTYEEHVAVFMLIREHGYRQCDLIARRDGRLTKMLMLMDLTGASMSDILDRGHSGIQQEVSKISAVIYPQMISTINLVNTPGWMNIVFRFFTKIMPARLTSKVRMYPNADAMWKSEEAGRRLNRARIPKYLGGTMPDDEVPKALTGELLDPDADRLEKVVVANRSKEEITLVVPMAGSSVNFLVSVEAYGISMEATLMHGEGEGVDAAQREIGSYTVLRAGGQDKIKAESGAAKGSWACTRPGVLHVTFDNSYSILRSKTISYKFDVRVPDSGASEVFAAAAAEEAVSGGAGGAAE